MNDEIWKTMSKNILKSELSRKNVGYKQLSEQLSLIGVIESAENINSKINRGTFSFAFFLQCMQAIETNNLVLGISGNMNGK